MYFLINWYQIFYWISVADGVKQFFDSASDLFTVFSVFLFIGWVVTGIGLVSSIQDKNIKSDEEEKVNPSARGWAKARAAIKPMFYTSLILSMICWIGYVFTPSKKDALIIVAGGAVGNFITSDSSARAIPAEVTNLLREKIRSELQELKTGKSIDDMTMEELKQQVREQQAKPAK